MSDVSTRHVRKVQNAEDDPPAAQYEYTEYRTSDTRTADRA